MKRQWKGFVSGIMVTLLLVGLIGTAVAAGYQKQATLDYTGIKITLDGKEITPTDANGAAVEPFAISGTTYLPVRAVANALGLGVEWEQSTQTVKLTGNGASDNKTEQAPPSNALSWDKVCTIQSLSYRVPSSWMEETKSGEKYYYMSSTKSALDGYLHVYTDDAGESIENETDAVLFLSVLSQAFKENDESGTFERSEISKVADGMWGVTFSFKLIPNSGVAFPCRVAVVTSGNQVIIFSLTVPGKLEGSIDAYLDSLVASFSAKGAATATSQKTTTISDGMYKVGTDIPAGTYKLTCTSSYSAYWERAKDASGELSSIIANSNFSTTAYVTAKNGEYFTITRCDGELQ